MGVLSSINPFRRDGEAEGGGTPGGDIEAFEIDEALRTDVYDAAKRELPILGIRPYPGEPYKPGERLLKALHVDDWEGRFRVKNTSVPHALELMYDDNDEILQFRFAPGDENGKHKMLSQLKEFYPESDIIELSPQFMDLPEGAYAATCRLELIDPNYHYPIKHYKIDKEDYEHDPLGSVARQMIGAPSLPDADVMVQTVLRPAISHHPNDEQNWYADIPDTLREMGETHTTFRKEAIAEELANAARVAQGGQPRDVEYSSSVDLDDDSAYQVVKKQYGEKAYHLNFRIIAVSEDPDVAVRRVRETAGMYRNFYNSKNRQGFRTVPHNDDDGRDLLLKAAAREWVDRDMIMPVDTATGAAHVPTDLDNQKADYSMTRTGRGVPPRTPQFDYEEHDLDRATSTREEKQKAMLTQEDEDEPVWYGTGKRNGREAGVWRKILDVHQFVGGSTGVGKTTLLINLFIQLIWRGFGGLFVFPKGDEDAEKLLSLLPFFREDDLIYLDIGGDSEYEVGFNFLEVPLTDPDPDSMAFESCVEAMADDIEGLLAQSGDGTWHARMSGITRSVVRGLVKWQLATDRTVTMLDMYYALLDDQGRQEYADMLTQERIEWIEDYAQRVLSDTDQSEVEPLLRRLKEWVENGVTRRIASHPSNTFSIEDAVAEGKIIVVRNRTNSDNAQRMIATALIRRIWMAIREQTNNDSLVDPPNFYVFLDECDKVITEQSKFHDILKQARSFGLSITLSCQNLVTGDHGGVPETLLRAIQGNCKTFISFDPGDHKDAKAIAPQHSPDISWEDLTELSPYHFYMRTRDENDEKTDSYMVEGYLPAEDVLDSRGGSARAELVAKSQQMYGAKRRTSAQIKRDTTLYRGDPTDDDGGADAAGEWEVDEIVRAWTCKAVYDQAIRDGHLDDNEGWVPIEDAETRIKRYLPEQISADLDTRAAVWDRLIEHISEDYLERQDRSEGVYLRCTSDGQRSIFRSGDSPSAGGGGHRLLLKDLYRQLTELGLIVKIPIQGGPDDEADAIGSVGDIELLDFDADDLSPSELRKRLEQYEQKHPVVDRLTDGSDVVIEAECSTGDSGPYQTVVNTAQAVQSGRRCLLACRPDTASSVYNTMDEAPQCMRATSHGSDDQVRLYNGASLSVGEDGTKVYRRSGGDDVWLYDQATGEYILMDSQGREHARFESADAIFESADAYPRTADDLEDTDGWTTCKTPAVPERLFDGGLDPSQWDVLVVPRQHDDLNELAVYEDGELTPLSAFEDESEDASGQEHEQEQEQEAPRGPSSLRDL